MIIVRTVLHAQFGKGGELSKVFVEMAGKLMKESGVQRKWRILTDLSGTFDTVIQEIEVESLADWEQARTRLFGLPAFREAMGRTQGMVVSGQNELWTIEAEG